MDKPNMNELDKFTMNLYDEIEQKTRMRLVSRDTGDDLVVTKFCEVACSDVVGVISEFLTPFELLEWARSNSVRVNKKLFKKKIKKYELPYENWIFAYKMVPRFSGYNPDKSASYIHFILNWRNSRIQLLMFKNNISEIEATGLLNCKIDESILRQIPL